MSAPGAFRAGLGLATAWLLCGAGSAAGAEPTRLLVEFETPAEGAILGDPQRLAFVSGRALALRGDYRSFDLVFAIDTSRSTADPAGADVDGDGVVEQSGSEHDTVFGKLIAVRPARRDTILAAEVAAARTLLAQLDPRSTRIGLVSFGGDLDPLTPDATAEAELTAEYPRVEQALDRILERGPEGLTNMDAGLEAALAALERGASGAGQRIVLFMTDGQPTLPIENAVAQNTRRTLRRVEAARDAGIRIDTFALGADALREPLVVVEMARISGGIFTPVLNPADLRSVFEQVRFSELESLRLTNLGTGALAQQLVLAADGRFAALLELAEGPNRIELAVRASDGTEARREIEVQWRAGANDPALDARQLAQRTRLLELRLLELREQGREWKAERDRRLLEALREQIRRERARAEERAAAQRKQLEIEAQEPD